MLWDGIGVDVTAATCMPRLVTGTYKKLLHQAPILLNVGVGTNEHERMPASSLAGRCKHLERFCAFSSLLAVAVGAGVLCGWGFHLEPLKRILPGLVAMNPVTAMAFILCGSALWSIQKRRSAWLTKFGYTAASLVVIVGMLRFSAYVFNWDIPLDQTLFRPFLFEPDLGMPNRMAPNTALTFAVIGFGLLLIDAETRRGSFPAQYLALIAGFISLLALIGYSYRVKAFYGVVTYIPMALHTAGTLALLSCGLVCARPGKGLTRIFLADTAGGVIARRLLPAMVLVLITLGWLRLEGERHGLFGAELGVLLYTSTNIAILATLIWVNAKSLDRAETRRRQLETERELFFALSLDLLCIAGFDGFFKRLNPAWQATLGYTEQELLAAPFLDFVHPDDRPATVLEAQKLAQGAVTVSFENRYRCKDGSYRWFMWTAAPHVQQELIYSVAHDITERKQVDLKIQALNRELEHRAVLLEAANKELEAFSYSVSHDLRAPLRHIAGFVQLLQQYTGSTLDPRSQRCVKMIVESAHEMGKLIDDLLSFARMGRAEMRAACVRLETLVREVIDDLRPETQDRDIVWKIAPLPEVHADRALLRQVWVNLISNAPKYSRTRPRAEIEIGYQPAAGGEETCFVRDNGVGFDMRYVEKLFGVFQRLHDSEDFEGTGIGLANVRRIIGRHGGRTWAEGKVDGGATFYFSLPAIKQPASISNPQSPQPLAKAA